MRVSKKTDYALRALFTLVEHYQGEPIPIRELARRNDVPKRFLEQIMLHLNFDGILAPMDCVSVTAYKRCSQEFVCRFRRVFLDTRNCLANLIDQSTLTDVMKNILVSKREISMVFTDGEGI